MITLPVINERPKKKTGPRRLDPSKTATLRSKMMRDGRRRLRKLAKEVHQLLVVEDAFGLLDKHRPLTSSTSIPVLESRSPSNEVSEDVRPLRIDVKNRWRFQSDDQKIASFNQWMQRQLDSGLLELEGGGEKWTDSYVNSAYRKGTVRAYTQSHSKAMAKSPDFYYGSREQFLIDSFAQPETMSKLRMLGTRPWESLKGISSHVSAEANRIAVEGLAAGRHPHEISKRIVDVIGGEEWKVDRIARTEIIAAHAEGQLDAFDRLGIKEVSGMAEWMTAGDSRVCDLCFPLEGMVIPIDEARGMLPRHPNCRCAWAPSFDKPKGTQKKIDKSIAAERKKGSLREKKKKSSWPGADKKIQEAKRKTGRIKRRGTRGVPKKRPTSPPRPTTAPAPELWNHQPTAVLRWMGKEGWSFEDAKKVLKARGLNVKDPTIKTQLSAGRLGKRGAPAKLTDLQVDILKKTRERATTTVTPPTPPTPKPTPKPIPKSQTVDIPDNYRDIFATIDTDGNEFQSLKDAFRLHGAEEGIPREQVSVHLKSLKRYEDPATGFATGRANKTAIKEFMELIEDAQDQFDLDEIFREVKLVRYKGRTYIQHGDAQMAAARLLEKTDSLVLDVFDIDKAIQQIPVNWDQSTASLVRWMGREGMSFDEAKKALRLIGKDLRDSTIKTQLGAGRKGLRGAVAKLSPKQEKWLKARIGKPIPDELKPPMKTLPPKVVTPNKTPTPADFNPWDVDETYAITHTGRKTEFGDKVRKMIDDANMAKIDPDVDDMTRLGRFIEEEIDRRMERAGHNLYREIVDSKKEEIARTIERYNVDRDAVQKIVYDQSTTTSQRRALKKVYTDRHLPVPDDESLARAHQRIMHLQRDLAAYQENTIHSPAWLAARRDITTEVLSEIRDMGGVKLEWFAKSNRECKKGFQKISKHLPKDWLERLNKSGAGKVRIDGQANPRGFHRPPWGSYQQREIVTRPVRHGEIGFGPKELSENNMLHELTHATQHASKRSHHRRLNDLINDFDIDARELNRIQTAERKFIQYRRKRGEHHSKIYSWLDDEWCIEDHFTEKYAGKDYNVTSITEANQMKGEVKKTKEVITIGVEGVFYGMHNVQADPHFYRYILAMLATM